MLLALADRRERIRHPIRILLLERGLEGAFEKVMGVGGDRAIIESKRFRGEPLTLSRLKDTDLVAIASESAVQAGGSTAPSTVIDALNNTGTATPLLAALLGEGKTDSGRTRDEFLISYLGREEARRWAPAKVGDRDKNLCGLATMLDGMNVEELAELRRDGIDFPTAKNYSPERLSAMTGFTTTDEVQPLRPHLIGEIFVLERLNSLNKIVRQNLLRLMWNAYPRCLQFLHRCREDFPHHRMTAQLSEAPKSASEPALEYSTLILFSDFLRCSGKASRPKARELLAALDRVNGQRGLPIRHNEFRQNQRTLAHLYWAAFEAEDGSPETAIKMVKEWAGHNLGDIQKDRWALDPFFVIPVSEVLQQIVTAFVGQQRYTEGYNAFLSLLFMAEQSEELEPAECLAKCSVAAGFALENAGEGKSALQQYERFRRLEAGLVKKQWLMRSANTTSRVRLDLLLAFAAKSLIVLMQSDSSVRRAAEASLIDLKQRTYGDSSSVPIASIYVQALILSDSELRILAGGKVPQRPIRNSKTLAELTGASKYYRKQADAFQELIASTVLLAESAIAFLDNDTRTAIPSWMVATQALKDAKRLDANLDHLAFWGAATLDLLTRILAANMESDFLRMTEVYLEAVEQVVENNGVFNHSMMDISLILLQYGVRLENDGDPTFMEKLTESTERMAYWAHERSKSSTNSG